MPIMNGHQATKHILRMARQARGHGEEELTHIVALTSYTSINNQKKCREYGMKGVYNKPIRLPELTKVMERHFYRTAIYQQD